MTYFANDGGGGATKMSKGGLVALRNHEGYWWHDMWTAPYCLWQKLNIQATRCSFSGRLDSDPDSTVHISGCPNEENMDISLMSKKVIVPFCFSTWSNSLLFCLLIDHQFTFALYFQSNLQYNTYRVDKEGKQTIHWFKQQFLKVISNLGKNCDLLFSIAVLCNSVETKTQAKSTSLQTKRSLTHW